jgi:hypothetical protein
VERPTCGTCPYWDVPDTLNEEENDGNYGNCRRHAPSPVAVPEADIDGDDAGVFWPITTLIEWCGEHPDFPVYLTWLKRNRALEILASESVTE